MGLVHTRRCVYPPFVIASNNPAKFLLGADQTFLQTLLLPLCLLPTLIPTPLIEPRYFLIPYILLRAQVSDVHEWMVGLEFLWYTLINGVTMYVFLYKERAGVGRFMW